MHRGFICCKILVSGMPSHQYASLAQAYMCACFMQEAIISGFFRGQPGPEAQASACGSSAPELDPELESENDIRPCARMDAVLSTALEVANGMMYLHARSIVHGDLTGANVLLQECAVSLLCPFVMYALRIQP